MKKRKVLVIGWDAADWKVIQPLVDQGLMPTFKSLMEEGVYGNISTLDPPLSPMLWTSIATGKRAYDHGILGFAEPTDDGTGIRPVQVTSRKVKAIWNILNQKGCKSNVVGWWPSFPAEPINGVMVSNHYQVATKPLSEEWPMPEGHVHPPEKAEELAELRVHPGELTPNIMLPFLPHLAEMELEKNPIFTAAVKNVAQASSLHAAVTHLMETTEWDFTAIYLDTIDHFCHLAMKYHPPQQEWIPDDKFKYFQHLVNSAYRFHDMMLERLLKLAGDDCTVVLLSDHGFHSDHLRLRSIPKEPAGPAHEHRQYGVFLMKGPGIKKGERIFGTSLLDVCPTLLHLYGLPVGEDMEGRVVLQAFEQVEPVQTIPSWEEVPGADGMHPPGVAADTFGNQEAVQQLVDLGYVEAPEDDGKFNPEKSYWESRFYLGISYMDARQPKKALPYFEELTTRYPEAVRYGQRHMSCLITLKEYKQVVELAERLRRHKTTNPALDFYEAIGLYNTGRQPQADDIFSKLRSTSGVSVGMLIQVASVYRQQERYEEAGALFTEALKLDKFNSTALTGMGILQYKLGNHEKALDFFLDSVDQLFFQPKAHYYISECLLALEMPEKAAQALEVACKQAPNNLRARELAVEIYNQLGKEDQAATHREYLEIEGSEPLVVVSGMPRTGTSMLMQMLEKGGLEVVTDGARQADESNPKGYYELERVKKKDFDREWLKSIRGKGVKIVAPLVMGLTPGNRYKVIFMERPLHEVLVSQQVMLGKSREHALKNFPLALANQFQKQLDKVNTWLDHQHHMEVLRVNYYDVVHYPEEWVPKIAAFVGAGLSPEKMMEAIDVELHRNRLT